VHSSGGSTFLRIYSKNDPAKIHPDPTRNDGTLGFFEEFDPTRRTMNKKKNRMSSNMRSVPDLKNSGQNRYLWTTNKTNKVSDT